MVLMARYPAFSSAVVPTATMRSASTATAPSSMTRRAPSTVITVPCSISRSTCVGLLVSGMGNNSVGIQVGIKLDRNAALLHRMAGHLRAIGLCVQNGLFTLAARIGVRATRMKGAAGRWIQRTGDFAGNGELVASPCVQLRQGREQQLRVRMLRRLEQYAGRRQLGQPAQVHHAHVVR